MVTTARSESARPPRASSATPKSRGRIGWVVALSVAAGLVVAAVLAAAPFVPANAHSVVGVVLLGFALGWASLAVLSGRLTDQPQRWALAPALFMGVAGLASLSSSAVLQGVLSWVWPPVMLGLAAWMFLRVRRQMHSRLGRVLLYPVLAVIVIASVGGGYETVRESLDARAYPMPGQLFDVGGHRLHLYCTGSGSPTVILEPGGGAASSDFGWIAPAVARDTTVCVYDRAGRGWSDPTDRSQDGAHIAADLHTLLERAQVPGPYVLAGHSFGGLYVQSFAAQFPDQVAGLVLLDSTAPKPGAARPIDPTSSYVIDRIAALSGVAGHLGLGRLIALDSYATFAPRSRDEGRANSSTPDHLASFVEEFFAYSDTAMQQASALTSLNGKPLIVLTADEGASNDWQPKQDRLATLSTNSLHRHANATHDSLISDENDSAAASQAIHDVVQCVRTGQPLA